MFAEFCVRRPVFTTMLVVLLVVMGVFSFRDLSVDLLPKADPATVAVTLTLPGASPEELNSAVAEPAEQSLSSIAGIDEMNTVIREGNARITLKFVLERDINDAAQDVREKVAQAIKDLPPELLPPVITKVDPDSDPVISFAVSGPLPIRVLTEIADKRIRRAIETADGVGEVTISGGRAREIHVVLDIAKLNAHGLTVGAVRDAIVSENVEIPGGYIEQGDAELTLRTLGRIESTEQFANIVVANAGRTPIRLRDVASVEDTTEEARTGAFFDGNRSLIMDVRRQSGQNTVEVIAAVKKKMDEVRRGLPQDVIVAPTHDDSNFIHASIASLEEHLVAGSLLASLVILVFIRNLRVVAVASLAIPASLIASFALIRAAGFTLNSMTLLGLTLAVGIVIDDAIVVLENIFRHMEEENAPPFQAAITGTKEVTLAVVATSVSLDRHFPAGRVHDRLHAAVHLSLRLHDGVCRHGVAAREPDADADAERARRADGRPGAAARRRRVRAHRSLVSPVARVVPRSSRGGGRRQRRRLRVDVRAEQDDRPVVPAERGHGRVPARDRHAGGHVAPGHGEGRPRAHAEAAGRARRRARAADDLRAREPLPHPDHAEARRRAQVAGSRGARRPAGDDRVSELQADDRDAVAHRRRRDRGVSDPVQPHGTGSAEAVRVRAQDAC